MGDVVRGSDEKSSTQGAGPGELTPGQLTVLEWLHSLQWKGAGEPDGHACLTGKCGETIEIFLKFNGERVKEAAYLTNGCISSKVCAALAAHMARGKSPDEITEITAQSILEFLGEFPKSEEHCAFLAAETLQEALHRYMLKESKKP
ncbi:MAG: iron-sulfur cluster assembly scaffold protein [Desulfobacterota bacterium]|jgi:nitrogen fixation NifU-like protein|nr:iron-sulfur cluster assembly scaffold protein [Thermodesulfobacteriota bacterium]